MLMRLLVSVALLAALQSAPERHTPPGEWCQRPPLQSQAAHACTCQKQDCTDADPQHVSAHVDPMCQNYCHIDACRCEQMDCP